VSFQRVNALYIDLRDGLRAQIDPVAIGDLNVRPPSGSADEASFLRLTAWCYALLFEVGRTSIPFLLKLAGFSPTAEAKAHRATQESVHCLRTSLSHNLGFDDGHDLQIRKGASEWFLRACGAIFPASEDQWKACFIRLCSDVEHLLTHSISILSAAAASPERDITFAALRQRLKRDWPAHVYDEMVTDAAARIGEKINARALRERRLNDWRRFVEALSDETDMASEVERLIESDVLEHFRARLPISARDLIVALELAPGPRVKTALEIARQAFASGITSRELLIDAVRDQLG